jgi:hypothetical protein
MFEDYEEFIKQEDVKPVNKKTMVYTLFENDYRNPLSYGEMILFNVLRNISIDNDLKVTGNLFILSPFDSVFTFLALMQNLESKMYIRINRKLHYFKERVVKKRSSFKLYVYDSENKVINNYENEKDW